MRKRVKIFNIIIKITELRTFHTDLTGDSTDRTIFPFCGIVLYVKE